MILCVGSPREHFYHISTIWDPLGLTSPIVTSSKVLFQKLWLVNIGWDKYLPDDINQKWLELLKDLSQISTISIPRFISLVNVNHIELIGFADASQQAYGACLYIRATNNDNIL